MDEHFNLWCVVCNYIIAPHMTLVSKCLYDDETKLTF